jgi:cobalamin biosynthesis Mg chelatase CobN
MPTEQSQVEYYHYYRASQKRVQQWVQKTNQELEAGSAGRSSDLRLNDGDSSEDAGRRNGSGSRRRASRRRSPSSSKRQIHNQADNLRSRGPSSRSRSTRQKAKTHDVRSRKSYSSDGLAISSLLSFGVFPLIFVLTPPSVATLFSVVILLAGYFCVDYGVSTPCQLYIFLQLIPLRKRSRSLRICPRRGRHSHRLCLLAFIV